jgi:hypothetical protein
LAALIGFRFDEDRALVDEELMETGRIDDELAYVRSQRLIQNAEDNFVPYPEDLPGGMWKQSALGKFVLTTAAIAQLQTDIRKEKKRDQNIGVLG